MPFLFETDRIEVSQAFLREKIPGVSVKLTPSDRPQPPPGMAYDSAEDFLKLIVDFSYNLDINLLATWLALRIEQAGSKKSRIDSEQIPNNAADIAILVKRLIEADASKTDREKNKVGKKAPVRKKRK